VDNKGEAVEDDIFRNDSNVFVSFYLENGNLCYLFIVFLRRLLKIAVLLAFFILF